MEIIWSEFAEKQLDGIFQYYNQNAGTRIAKKLIRSLLNEPKKLIKSPYIGQIENLLQKRDNTYRFLIFKNYKIIYSVDHEKGFIKVADVFDTRQNPEKIERTE